MNNNFKKIVENYSIKRDIYEIENKYNKTVSQFEFGRCWSIFRISYNGYQIVKEVINITLPDRSKNKIDCFFVFYNIDRIDDLIIKEKEILGEVNIDKRGWYFPEENTIQLNIPFEFNRNRDDFYKMFSVLNKKECLDTLKYELSHAYDYLMKEQNRYTKNIVTDYQQKIFEIPVMINGDVNHERLFFDLIYWLFDKDEFSAWMFNEKNPVSDKDHSLELEIWIKILKRDDDKDFWNEMQNKFCSILLDQKIYNKVSKLESLAFKKYFIDECFRLYNKFLKKKARDEIQDKYAREGRKIIFDDIKKYLNEEINYKDEVSFRTSFYSFKRSELIPFVVCFDYDENLAYVQFDNTSKKIPDSSEIILKIKNGKVTDSDVKNLSNLIYNFVQYDLSILNDAYNRMIYRKIKNIIDWNCEFDEMTMEELDEIYWS